MLSIFLNVAVLVGVKWYLIVVSLCISLMTNIGHLFLFFFFFFLFAFPSWLILDIFSCFYWYISWRNVYSNPLPLKKLSFYCWLESSFFVYSELIRHLLCKYSFILCLHILPGILWSINIFNYDEVQFFSIFICIFVLCHYLIQGHEDLQFIILLFWECYGFSFYIYILIYFELTFVYGLRHI